MTERNTTFAMGITAAIIGAIFLLMPWLVGGLVSVIVGIGLLATGASCLTNWLNLRVMGAGRVSLYVAIAAFIVGLICLIHPLTGAGAINWIISMGIMFMGLCLVLDAVSSTMDVPTNRIAKGIAGIVILVLGFTSFTNPGIICQLTGVALLIVGLANILIAKVTGDAFKPFGGENPASSQEPQQAMIEDIIDVTPTVNDNDDIIRRG